MLQTFWTSWIFGPVPHSLFSYLTNMDLQGIRIFFNITNWILFYFFFGIVNTIDYVIHKIVSTCIYISVKYIGKMHYSKGLDSNKIRQHCLLSKVSISNPHAFPPFDDHF